MDIDFATLRDAYLSGALTPRRLVNELMNRCSRADSSIWIHRLSIEELEPFLLQLDACSPMDLPLYGVPFAIKDNIDLAEIPTTAGCPAYGYLPSGSAFVVQRLIDAGAIPLGKTNMDQFATGLVGTRSPYGICRNTFDSDYISGGSSSGSALAVAQGLCSFSLGTDTAGSGRVPAAFNNLIGLKPSRGLLSMSGVVPACRSLDSVSIFALCAGDAQTVLEIAASPDADDPYSRQAPDSCTFPNVEHFRFGVPSDSELCFFGDEGYATSFKRSVELLELCGGEKVEVDLAPFLEAARLLYEGPWVAERHAAVGAFIESHAGAVHPVVEKIICGGPGSSAEDLFRAMYRLQALKKQTDAILKGIDLLVTPTAGTCYTVAQVEADPIRLNSNLGAYTNFMNLLDYCGVAVPTSFSGRLPFGITLVGQRFTEDLLLNVAARLHAAAGLPLGSGNRLPPSPVVELSPAERGGEITFAVCGAHLRGLPLNDQLTRMGGQFVEETHTAPCYRMYALVDAVPPKPGLVRDPSGRSLPVELWRLSADAFGRFVADIPHPLGMGKLELEDGRWVSGFIAEPGVADSGTDITASGGWRAFIEMLKQKGPD